MNLIRLMAVARKEVIQIRRDSRSLFIVLVMPVVLVLLFGYGVNLDLKHQPIYVFDRDGNQESQDLLKRFQASEYFEVVKVAGSYAELQHALDAGEAKMAVVLPWDFSRKLRSGEPIAVQALVDASDDNTANILIGYTQAVVQRYAADEQSLVMQQSGQLGTQPSLTVEARTWFNEDLESRDFVVPGVLALVMSVIGAFLTSLTIAREWERGSMEQLVSTPVTPLEIMLGKLLPYFVVGMFAAVVCSAIGIFWFEVPFRGSLWTLMFSTALFLVAVLCLGFFISVVARNQLAASQAALISTFLPAFLLSGFLFSIDQMPPVIQLVTRVVPARYYTSLLKAIFLKGTPISMLYGELLPLAIYTLFITVIATRAFHKNLD